MAGRLGSEKDMRLEKDLIELKPELSRRFGVRTIGYFYEFCDPASPTNVEVNIIVTLAKPLGWKFFEMKEFLEMRLRRRIDMITPKGLKTLFREDIEKCVKHL